MSRIDEVLAPRQERKQERAPNAEGPALPFEALLNSSARHAEHTRSPGTGQAFARQVAEQPPEGIALSFESSRDRRAGLPADAASVAGETPGRHVASGERPGRAEASAWDKASRRKDVVANMLPGGGKERPTKSDPPGMRALDGKGLPLEARAVSRRADGTPIVRDATGSARVVHAQNPDKALGPWLQNEADDAEVKRVLRDAFNRAGNNEPTRTPEAYARRSEQIRAEAPVKLAEQIRRDAADPTRLEALNTRNTNNPPERQAELREQPAPSEGREADRTARNTRGDSNPGQRDMQQNAQNREGRTEAGESRELRAKAGTFAEEAARLAGGSTEKSATSRSTAAAPAPDGNIPIQRIDASPVAAALQQGVRAEATSRMAALLQARVDYMLNQQQPELRLQLTPRDMGTIQIRLIAAGDNHLMRVQAERQATARVIELAAPQLIQQLSKVGVQVSQVAVDYGSTDFTQTGHGGQAQTSRQDGEGSDGLFSDMAPPDSPPDEPGAPVSTHDGELDVLA